MIVFYHIAQVLKWSLFCYKPPVFHIFYLNPGVIGVAILIFVSGAMLEYSHPKLDTVDEVSEFWVKRLFRIYPAFWMSMIIGLVCIRLSSTHNIPSIFSFSLRDSIPGAAIGAARLTSVTWFVGLIVTLYFCYPFLSASIRKYPYLMLFLIAFIEIFPVCPDNDMDTVATGSYPIVSCRSVISLSSVSEYSLFSRIFSRNGLTITAGSGVPPNCHSMCS